MDNDDRNSDYLSGSQVSCDDEDTITQLYVDKIDYDIDIYSNDLPQKEETSNNDIDGDRKTSTIESENDNFEFESIDVSSNEDGFEYIDKIDDDESIADSFEFIFPGIGSINELSVEYIEQCSCVQDLLQIIHLSSSTIDPTKKKKSQDLISSAWDRLATLHQQQDNIDFASSLNRKASSDQFSMEFIKKCNSVVELQRAIRCLKRSESANVKQSRELIKAAMDKLECLVSAPVFEYIVDNHIFQEENQEISSQKSENESANQDVIDTTSGNLVSTQETKTPEINTQTNVNTKATASAECYKCINTNTSNYVAGKKSEQSSYPPLTPKNLCNEIREYSKRIQEFGIVDANDVWIKKNQIPMRELTRIFGIKRSTPMEKQNQFQKLINMYCTLEIVERMGAFKRVLILKESVLDGLDDIDSKHEDGKTITSRDIDSQKQKKPSAEYTVQDIKNCNSKQVLQRVMRKNTPGTRLHETAKRRLLTLFPPDINSLDAKKLSYKSTIEDIENCNSIPDLRRLLRNYSKIECDRSKKKFSAKKRLEILLFNSNVSQNQKKATPQSEDIDYALALSLSYESDHYHGGENFYNTENSYRHSTSAKVEDEINLSHELNYFPAHCEDETQEISENCFCYRNCDIQITKDKEPGQTRPLKRHPGNLWLQDIISKKTLEYFRMDAVDPLMARDKKRAERELVLEILRDIRRSGRRFFRLYEGLGVVWVEIDDKDAHDEVEFLFKTARLHSERMQAMLKKADLLSV